MLFISPVFFKLQELVMCFLTKQPLDWRERMSRRPDQEEEMSDTQTEQTGIRDRAREYIYSTKQHRHVLNCKVGLVHPTQVPHIWEKVHEHLLRMAPHSEGELEPEDIFEALTEGEMQLWAAVDDKEILATMVTQVVPYPRKRVLRIISIGGEDMDRWLDHLPMVEEWALEMGCTSL